MKRETRSVYCRLSWLSLVIVLLLTAACSAATINTATSSATTASQSTGVLPAPTQPPAQPASTQPAPTEPPATPTNSAPALPPAPVCDASVKVTPSQTEGPYYKPDTPERASLVEPGMSGTKLIVTGVVLTTDCKPIAGAWLDFWQANDEGVYDNAGYTLRGHQATDENGRYTLDTILPGLYPGRTRHIHVKVQAPNHPVLTTQLYFPDEPSNNSDSIFDPALIVNLQDTANGKVATFNFVLDVK
jgi:protocatechuate 3,4-dioxygenase beta subunit